MSQLKATLLTFGLLHSEINQLLIISGYLMEFYLETFRQICF